MPRGTQIQNLSLEPMERLALRWLATFERKAGKSDGNISAAAGRLIRDEMIRRFGPRWERELPAAMAESSDEAAA